MTNPFAQKLPVNINDFSSRLKVNSRLTENTRNNISSMILSEPRMASHSLLRHFLSPQNRLLMQSSLDKHLVFGYVNSQSLSSPFNEMEFWKLALKSLDEHNDIVDDTFIITLIKRMEQKDYSPFELRQDLRGVKKTRYRLVLVVSEFDHLLSSLGKNAVDFCAILRSMIIDELITLIISSYQPNIFMNASPLINILYSIRLGCLSNREVSNLLNFEGSRFTSSDRSFISSVAGGHPFLIKVAASAVWDESLGDKKSNIRYINAGKRIYDETKTHFSEIWKIWSPAKRKAITSIALIQTPHILSNHSFLVGDFLDELPKYRPEMDDLESLGTIAKDQGISGGYKLTQGAMIWWLVDELIRTMRDEQVFQDWIQEKELIGGLVKKKELDKLQFLANKFGGLLHEGAISLIKAYAEGLVNK